MTTEGRRLVQWAEERDLYISPKFVQAEVAAIEAAVIAAERARIAEVVRGLFGQVHPMAAIEDEPTRHDVVSRKAVLAIVENP